MTASAAGATPYGWLFGRVVFPVIQGVLGRSTMKDVESLDASQWMDPAALRALQLAGVRTLIERAADVPYYRERFAQAGLRAEDVRTWQDFASLPLLRKSDLREDPTRLCLTRTGLIEGITGGSTGEALRFYFDQRHMARVLAATVRSRRWWGLEPHHRMAYLWGHYRSFDRSLKGRAKSATKVVRDRVLNRIWLSAYDMSDERMTRYYERLRRYRPVYMLGYTSALYGFAYYLRESGCDGRAIGLSAVVSTSEVLYEWQAVLLREVFGCPVVNEYGALEAGIMAYSCPAGGLHTIDENVVLEVVDNRGRAVAEGIGDVVVTNLVNHGAPLIRYHLGDVAEVMRGSCPCGRGLGRLAQLHGRTLDLLVLPGGGYASGHLVAQLLESFEPIRKMQIVQDEPGSLRVLTVKSRPLTTDERTFFERELRKRFGDDLKILIEEVADIPADPSGKYRWVRSRVWQTRIADRPHVPGR